MTTLIIILIIAVIINTAIASYSIFKDTSAKRIMAKEIETYTTAYNDFINEKQNLSKIIDANKKAAEESYRNYVKAFYDCQCLREQLEKQGGPGQIAIERARQKSVEGYDQTHDIMHPTDEFCRAAIAYVVHDVSVIPSKGSVEGWWPEKWNADMFKPKDRKRNLVRAGALIAAAIDRLQYEETDEQ
jgi:hypothetical protein